MYLITGRNQKDNMLAKEIQEARKAGLVMTVVDGRVEWIGNPQQWQDYQNRLNEYEQ